MLADILLPDGTADEREAFARLQRRAIPMGAAVAALRAVPCALGRELATRIPGARFQPLAGRNHLHRHVANVRRKLGVTSRAAAAAWAAQHGLV